MIIIEKVAAVRDYFVIVNDCDSQIESVKFSTPGGFSWYLCHNCVAHCKLCSNDKIYFTRYVRNLFKTYGKVTKCGHCNSWFCNDLHHENHQCIEKSIIDKK